MSIHPNALTEELPVVVADQPLDGFTGSAATLPRVAHEAWNDGTASLAPLEVQPDPARAVEYSPPSYSTFFPRQTSEVEPKRPVLQQLYVEDPKYPGQWTEVWGDSDLDYYDESTRRAVTDPHTLAALNGTVASATPSPTILPGIPPELPNLQSPSDGDHHILLGVKDGKPYIIAQAGSTSDKRFASAVRHASKHISEVHGDTVVDDSPGKRGGRRGRSAEEDEDNFQGVEAEELGPRGALLAPPKHGGKLGQVRKRDILSPSRIVNPFFRIGVVALISLSCGEIVGNGIDNVAHWLDIHHPSHALYPEKYLFHFDPLQPIHDLEKARKDG